MIRNATTDDCAAITEIYNHYILKTTVTFEEDPITPIQMVKRVSDVQAKYPWLVYEVNEKIAGYAYANEWKTRAAYRHTVEASIYLDLAFTGNGIGKKLYTALLKRLEALNIHTVIGGVAMPNEASVRLHESLGFRKVGHFREVGFKFGKWIDVAYWDMAQQATANNSANSAIGKYMEHYY